ncbi:MAG: PDZ domain-containing protein, partial [Kiritimatiellaeota bacterium]|nr:PDZ domain-containing protein [Kiritimatiellota bacterium]
LMLPSFLGGDFREEGEQVGSVVRWIGHAAVIFPGNSGGPLVNLNGEIVGVHEIGLGSLGGAIPSAIAQDVAQQLIASGRVQRSWTGIEGQARPKNLGIERGVLVGGVLPDSPAMAAGLKAGDVLVKYDDIAVDARINEDMPAFNRLLLSTPVGKQVEVVALRDGKEQKLSFTTRVRGKAWADEVEFKEWGMVVRNLTLITAIERQRPDTNGVLIASVGLSSSVTDAKPAIYEGCIIVEVAGQPIRSVADLRKVTNEQLKGVEGTKPVLVKFDQGKRQLLTVVKIGKEQKRPDVEPARKPGFSTEFQALSPDLAAALGLKGRSGALVTLVYRGHNAEHAGLKAGDILLKLDGDAVKCERPEDVDDLYAQVRRYRIGKEIPLEILRDGKTQTINLKLDEDLSTSEEREPYKDDVFDLTVEKLTELERIHRDIPADLKAVKIASIETGGWAQLASISGGDVLLAIDGTTTADVDTAKKLLKKAAAAKAKRVVFFLRRGIHTFFAEVEPDWSNGNNAGKKKAEKK